MRLHRKALTHRKLLHMGSLYIARFYTEKLLHTEAFAHSTLLHREAFTRSKPLHRKAFTQRSVFAQRSFYTEKPLETDVFTHGSFYREKRLHTEAYSQNLLRTSLRKTFPSTTLYYKACKKEFPLLLCTTKLRQNTSPYCFVLQIIF